MEKIIVPLVQAWQEELKTKQNIQKQLFLKLLSCSKS